MKDVFCPFLGINLRPHCIRQKVLCVFWILSTEGAQNHACLYLNQVFIKKAQYSSIPPLVPSETEEIHKIPILYLPLYGTRIS